MKRRRIVHVVYSFAIGGLENVIVQLINRLPTERYEHIVLSLTTISDFKDRIERPDVQFIALNKQPGHAIPLYPKIYRLLRQLKPDVLHTCNLAALELVPLGWLARIPSRIHAEHGWDAHDPNGTNPRYIKVRKLYKPFVSHYIAVSRDLNDYLEHAIGIPATRRSLIANGVDTDIFHPAECTPPAARGCPFQPGKHWLLGTVGRMQTVKNQPYLARAFIRLRHEHPETIDRLRLILIGEGPLRGEVERILREGNALDAAWLPGPRDDIPDLLRQLDCFVLPSQAEGTSCTLQEAMASGLPCIATAVGGTPKLIQDGQNGRLISPDDDQALANALWQLHSQHDLARQFGLAARQTALDSFAINGMMRDYARLFS